MNNPSITIGAMYSSLCTQELLSKIVPMFNIPSPIACEFLCQGLNDSYKVTTESDSYLLRIYRKEWRTKSDIEFELSILNHLHREKINVAYPLVAVTGEQIVSVTSPEGERFAIMTSFAEGQPLLFNDSYDAELYGKSVAKIHKHSGNISTQHERFKIDLIHLIEEPLKRIKPYLKHRESDWLFLKSYASTLSKNIANSQSELLDFGFCHGDFHGGNAHKSNGELTFFDFDCCGIGFRAYDLAVYKWSARLAKKEEERWVPFIKAYREVREISEHDLALVDDYVSIRHIWLMGLHTDIALAKGWLTEKYFTHQLKFLKDACDERQIEICVQKS